MILTIFLVTSFSISISEDPKEKDFFSTELKQYADVSSKPKSSLNSYFAPIYFFRKKKMEDLVTIRNRPFIFSHGSFTHTYSIVSLGPIQKLCFAIS